MEHKNAKHMAENRYRPVDY